MSDLQQERIDDLLRALREANEAAAGWEMAYRGMVTERRLWMDRGNELADLAWMLIETGRSLNENAFNPDEYAVDGDTFVQLSALLQEKWEAR